MLDLISFQNPWKLNDEWEWSEQYQWGVQVVAQRWVKVNQLAVTRSSVTGVVSVGRGCDVTRFWPVILVHVFFIFVIWQSDKLWLWWRQRALCVCWLQRPIGGLGEFNPGLMCFRSGPISVELRVCRRGYVSGDRIQLSADIENTSSCTLRQCRIALMQVTTRTRCDAFNNSLGVC